MSIFRTEWYAEQLREYYAKHYGVLEADHWYDPPAVNVWVFRRERQIITLKCDLRTGAVEAHTEEI